MEHVLAQKYPAIEVILVDNASTDGSAEKICAAHPGVRAILNKSNLGFAAGMNQGIAASVGEYVVLLNQDVCLHEEFVAKCVDRIHGGDEIGAIGGRVFAWVGEELRDELRGGDGELTFLKKRIQGLQGVRSETEAYVFMPTGSFPFVRRKMLADLYSVSGCYYDEDFGTGWEDIDLFLRMQLRGWRCLFLPQASGWHVGSGSVGGNDTFLSKKTDYQKRIIRNRLFVIIKDLPAALLLRYCLYLAAAEAAMLPYLALRAPRSLLAWVRAWRDTLESLPALLGKRRLIQRARRVGTGYLAGMFRGF
jgi:GT2 family glycosyltransferase